jgi:hypothetical protein
MGYSLYVDGQLAFTVDDLVHLTWNSTTGAVQFPDGGDTQVLSHAAAPLAAADQVNLSGNPRLRTPGRGGTRTPRPGPGRGRRSSREPI